ncbi:MAG: hypothetical protein ACREXX_16690 [Gammaproteobacteria bacterium]
MTMRSGLSQAQEQALARPAPGLVPPPVAAPTTKEIPYDYVARFTLQGKRGNRVQDVINISTEGAFVAVAIGYSFIPARPPDLTPITVTRGEDAPLTTTTLAEIIAVIIASKLESSLPAGTINQPLTANHLKALLQPIVEPQLAQCLLLKLCGIDFKYSIVDSGTGRELQNQPIHNIAGLGEPTGERPFRPLAKPILFMPRSTIRIEVEEISEGPIFGYDEVNQRGETTGRRIGGELFIVLHGYKMLGYGTALT